MDQSVGAVLLREVQAELACTSRIIADLRRRVTYLSICLLGVRSAPFIVSQILPQQTLTTYFPKGKGKGKSPEDLRRAQAFHAFSSNDALNFSWWYQVWQVNFFFVFRRSTWSSPCYFSSAGKMILCHGTSVTLLSWHV